MLLSACFCSKILGMSFSHQASFGFSLACLALSIGLFACSQQDKGSLTISIQVPSNAYPTLTFPDVDSSETIPVHWASPTDTTIVANFSISEQQLALLTVPGSSSSSLILLTPRQQTTLSLRSPRTGILNNRQSSDFYNYIKGMQHFSKCCIYADSSLRAEYTDSMRAMSLAFIKNHPLSKGSLIALQAVGPDSSRLLPIENYFPLYSFLDSALSSTYQYSILLKHLHHAVNNYRTFSIAHATDTIRNTASRAPMNDYQTPQTSLPQCGNMSTCPNCVGVDCNHRFPENAAPTHLRYTSDGQ